MKYLFLHNASINFPFALYLYVVFTYFPEMRYLLPIVFVGLLLGLIFIIWTIQFRKIMKKKNWTYSFKEFFWTQMAVFLLFMIMTVFAGDEIQFFLEMLIGFNPIGALFLAAAIQMPLLIAVFVSDIFIRSQES